MIKKNILVVEDNHAILDVITLILESEAFNVYGLKLGENLFQTIAEFHPDAIIMDIMLPDIDGRELLDLLKAKDSTKHIPVLLISARYNESNYSLNGIKADGFISKPFDINVLIDKLALLMA